MEGENDNVRLAQPLIKPQSPEEALSAVCDAIDGVKPEHVIEAQDEASILRLLDDAQVVAGWLNKLTAMEEL
jgi:hypothetical protein